MGKDILQNGQTIFEQIKHTDKDGNEYWSARDMAKVLEYSEYRHFLPVIERAKEACANSGQQITDHFEDILEMITTGKTAQREVESVKLSRYACYLIVQNADPSKEIVIFINFVSTYILRTFAVKYYNYEYNNIRTSKI